MSALTAPLTSFAAPKCQPQRGRFAVNLGSNLANFGLGILVGLWFTPYLIRHLGVAAYGLVPLAVTVTSYMGLFTTALNAAVGRFITLSLDRHDYTEANRVFNTSFWGTVAVLFLLLGPALWLASQVRFFFNVPAGYEDQFAWLFLSTMGMFFLTTLASPFGIATFCRNRFDLSNAVAIATTLVRVEAADKSVADPSIQTTQPAAATGQSTPEQVTETAAPKPEPTPEPAKTPQAASDPSGPPAPPAPPALSRGRPPASSR